MFALSWQTLDYGLFNITPLTFLMTVPSVHMLTNHDAIDAHVPHHGGTVPASFEFVINFLPFVGTFN